jgi:hypothetical protein
VLVGPTANRAVPGSPDRLSARPKQDMAHALGRPRPVSLPGHARASPFNMGQIFRTSYDSFYDMPRTSISKLHILLKFKC